MKSFCDTARLGLCLAVLLASAALFSATAAEPFFFVQLTDPQLGMFTDNADFVQETANFEFAVATVNRLRPVFVVITGDLVHKPGDAAQIAEYWRIATKIGPGIPVYHVAGNHDVGNVPTPDSLAFYREQFGADRYTFRHGDLVGVVLNSSVIHSPEATRGELEEQEQWLKGELERARTEGARHIVIFQHHPWFLKAADEPDEYFNIPGARRGRYLELFRASGVRYLFSGHYHRNAVARDGVLEAVTTGPVGKPLAGRSGLRIVMVSQTGIEHRYYDFGELPPRLNLEPRAPPGAAR